MLKKKQQEVFFVATPDKGNKYTFELDVNAAGKDSFGYMSGTYEMVGKNFFINLWVEITLMNLNSFCHHSTMLGNFSGANNYFMNRAP